MPVVGRCGLGTASSFEPEARGSQLCPAFSLYVERRRRPSNVAVAYRSRESEASGEMVRGRCLPQQPARRAVKWFEAVRAAAAGEASGEMVRGVRRSQLTQYPNAGPPEDNAASNSVESSGRAATET